MKRPPSLPPRSRPAALVLGGTFLGTLALTTAFGPVARGVEVAAPVAPRAPEVPTPAASRGGTDAPGAVPSFTLEEVPPPPPPKAKPADGAPARTARPRTRPAAKSSVSAMPPGGFPKADPSNALSTPSISPKSMCEEVRRTLAELQKNDARREEERRQLADQKAALEKLAADIAKARADLATETTRLVELAKKAAAEKPAAASAAEKVEKTAEKAVARQEETAAKAAEGSASRRSDFRSGPPSSQTLKAAREVSEKIRYTRPRQAADIVRSLDPALAALVLKEMSPEFAGKVLEKLDKTLAADLLRRGVALEETP
jgi:flagellar biosynthesis GTPase FlhF